MRRVHAGSIVRTVRAVLIGVLAASDVANARTRSRDMARRRTCPRCDLRLRRAIFVDDPTAQQRAAAPTRRSTSRASPGWSVSVRVACVPRRPFAAAVTDTRLGRALGDDFRGGSNPIGDGSALDAFRHARPDR